MSPKLSRLERVQLRAAWKHEASDFTPWLSQPDNLNLLAEALSLSELELVSIEHRVGDFKLDMLCTDGDDQVIIENQLEKTNHNHLGQLIAYAAGVGAKKVIWVAESFRAEHAAALQFLNDNTTDDLSFFAVEVELWRIGDSRLAPKFEAVVKPNNWTKTSREQAKAATTASPTKQLQLSFWSALVEKLATDAPHIRPQKPRPRHWMNNTIGRSGFRLNFTANTRDDRLGVELWMDGEHAKKHYANLTPHKEKIEADLGFALDWQELPDSLACRVAVWYPDVALTDESRWQEYLDWFVKTATKMDAVLRPTVKALP
ncbi:DUF4268 domain-containing protein [Polycyclovorans algicola]|uniref:DUF4268 domain-containing protein n=1 Tax=Polycyclovorans algicola TaxID=616992 RepID=UPI0004A6B059|nr:DUF4268 domain-containing protein [Polycyclovorans algicola]